MMLGLGISGSGGLFGSFLTQPKTDLGTIFKNAPVSYPAAIPTRAKDMDLGAAVNGAGTGAVAGGAIGGPIGAGVGAAAGLLDAILGKKASPASSSSGGGGLLDALGAGLRTIGIPGFGSKSAPINVTQTQSVSTDVAVTNVLGGRSFGNVDETGEFDTFQLLSDVFKIKDALNASSGETSAASYSTATAPAVGASSKPNIAGTVLVAAVALGAVYFLTRGKK